MSLVHFRIIGAGESPAHALGPSPSASASTGAMIEIEIRMGQAHVRRWVPEILPLLERDDDVLGLADFTTHRLPLTEAPAAYAMFQAKQDGAIKVVLEP